MAVRKVKKKPPVFKAANIELIHTNGSYEFPHELPDDSEFTEIPNVIPIEQTKYLCEVLLKGEWTYADWKGKRWFLKPGDYEASNTGAIWYVMVRDEWNEVINNHHFFDGDEKKEGARIKGILYRTNNRHLLTQWINTTKSPVDDPSDYLIINLKPQTEEFSIDISNLPMGLPWQRDYLTKNKLNDFLNNPNISLLIPGRCNGWEGWILDYVDQIIRSKKKYYLTKLTKIQSSLSNSWTLSYDEDHSRLGNAKEEGFLIPEIDFSNLFAITPVSISDHRKKALPNVEAGLEVTKEQSFSEPRFINKADYSFPWDLIGKNVDDDFIKRIPRGTIIKNPNNEHELYQINYEVNNLLTVVLINKMEAIEEAWNAAIKNEKKKGAIDAQLAKIDHILAYKAHRRKIDSPAVVDWLNKNYPKWKLEKLNSSLPKKLDANGKESYNYEEIFNRFLKTEVEVEPKYGYLFCFEDERYPEEPWMWDPSSYGTINYSSWTSALGVALSAVAIGIAAPFAVPLAIAGVGALSANAYVLSNANWNYASISKYLITFKNWPGGFAYNNWKYSMYSVPLISEILALKNIVFANEDIATENVKADSIMLSHYKSTGLMDDRKYVYSEEDLKNWSHSTKKYVYWISKKDQLSQGTHLFRLEGTNPLVYLIIHNGVPGIIFEDKKVAKEKKYTIPIDSLQTSELAFLDDKKKIHQRAYLNIFNKEYPLAEKLTENTPINLSIKAISDPTKTISYETYLVNWKSNIQTILETIQVPKERKSMNDPIAAILLENNLIRQQRNDEDYRIAKERYALKTQQDDWNFGLNVAREGLNMMTQIIGIATAKLPKVFTPSPGYKGSPWYGIRGNNAIQSMELEQSLGRGADYSEVPYEAPPWAGLTGRIRAAWAKSIDNDPSQLEMLGADYVAERENLARLSGFGKWGQENRSAIDSAFNLAKYATNRSYILQNRALTYYQLAENHHRREWDLKREIDSLSLVHRSASFTDLEATRKFNESIGADDIHIKIFYPSEEQMKIVDIYEREVGITVKANVTLDINKDIRGVWRFAEIDYISIEDPVTKKFIKAILLNGIRIVDRNKDRGEYIVAIQEDSIREKIEDLERKIFTCRAFLSETYTTAIQTVEKDVKERYKKKTEETINEIKVKLLTAENSLNKCLAENNELKKRPTQFELEQTVKEEKNKIWNQAIASSRITFRQNAKLQSEVTGLKQKIKQCEESKEQELNQEKAKWQAEKLLINRGINNILRELSKGNKVTINNVTREVTTLVDEDTLKEVNKKIEDDNKKLLEGEKASQDIDECKNQLAITRRIIEEKERKILEGERDKKDLEQCKKQLGITRGIIEEKQRTILAQAKEIENYKKGTGANPALLNCLQKRYENTYSRLIQTSRWVFEAILMFGELCNDINPIVSEMAQNTWSNSKSWAWTLKWLVDYWVAKVWIKLGAYQESGTDNATKNILSPFARMYRSKRIEPIGEVNKFLRWFTLTGELKEFDKSLEGKQFQRIRDNKEIIENIYSWTQLLGGGELRRNAEWIDSAGIATYRLNQNYPDYSVPNFGTTGSWGLFLQLKESGNYPSLEEIYSVGGISTDQRVAELHKLIYADERNKPWEVIKPDEFLNCAEQPENVRAEVIKVAPEAERIVPDDAQVKWIECEAENLKLKEEIERLKQPRHKTPKDYQELQLIKEQAEKAIKELSEGRNLNIANYPNLNKSHLEEINKKAIWKNNQIKDKTEALTTCTNNLNRVRGEYGELEAENTQNKNLRNLYRAESEKFKRERDEALTKVTELENFYTREPIQDTQEARKVAIVGLGKNSGSMFKNTYNINFVIKSLTTDYSNRVRSKSQTMANLGYYFNYLIDDILRVLDTYLGEKEKTYLRNKKINESNLRSLRQKRDASNEKPPTAPPNTVGINDF